MEFDGTAAPAEDAARLGVLQIPVADFADGLAVPEPVALLRRVFAARGGRQLLARRAPGEIGCERAMLAQRQPTRAPFRIAILHQVGLSAGGFDPHAKAAQLLVPDEEFTPLGRGQRVDRALG